MINEDCQVIVSYLDSLIVTDNYDTDLEFIQTPEAGTIITKFSN